MTPKAMKEIEQLREKVFSLKEEADRIFKQANDTKDWKISQVIRNEAARIDGRANGIEDRISRIEEREFSTNEWTRIKKEAESFKLIHLEKSIGFTHYTKVGYSKVVESYVKVEMIRWSSLMNNVRGCSSPANKKELDSIEILSEESYKEFVSGPTVIETYFCGAHEKFTRNPDGQVIKERS